MCTATVATSDDTSRAVPLDGLSTMKLSSPILGEISAYVRSIPRINRRHIPEVPGPSFAFRSRKILHSIAPSNLRPIQKLPRIIPPSRTPRRRSISTMSTAEAKEGLEGLNGTTGLPPAEESQIKVNAWSAPGPAAFDFRSGFPFLTSNE